MSIEILKRSLGHEPPLRKLFWKFLPKSFGGSKKVLTFASAFEKKAIKKSSLKDLDMNKQVVQDYSIKNYKLIIKNWELQKPSITWTS